MFANCNEKVITNALQEKHDRLQDIFAPQVKLGPAGSKIIDAIAIKKTWSPRTVIAYEIKTSRQDFLQDQKHPVYMENCNLFYFVTTNGIVQEGEIPKGAGHMIYNPETGKIRTKKKAPYRKQPINSDLLLHIMFWKAERYFGFRTRAERLEDYRAKEDLRALGHQVAKKISCLEIKIEGFNHSYYKQKYDEILNEWERLYGNRYIDFNKLNAKDGYSVGDMRRISVYLEAAKKDIERVSKIILEEAD